MIRCFINLLKAKLNNNTNTVKILLQFDNYYNNLIIIIKGHFDILIVYQDLVIQLLQLTQLYDIWQSWHTNTCLIPFFNNEVSMYLIKAFKSLLHFSLY